MDDLVYFLEHYRDIFTQIRSRLGVSMRKVAKVAGLCDTAMWYMEHDYTRNTEVDTVLYILLSYKKIAEEFGVDISDLLKPPSQKDQSVE